MMRQNERSQARSRKSATRSRPARPKAGATLVFARMRRPRRRGQSAVALDSSASGNQRTRTLFCPGQERPAIRRQIRHPKAAVFPHEAATVRAPSRVQNRSGPMTSFAPSGVLTTILPCNDLDASERFYNRLGFARSDSYRPPPGEPDPYRRLSNGRGVYGYLAASVERWLEPRRKPRAP